jgi:hypothetical protein
MADEKDVRERLDTLESLLPELAPNMDKMKVWTVRRDE